MRVPCILPVWLPFFANNRKGVLFMHIAFVSLGAFGHVNPTLALVTELVKQGSG